ncbi:hypothetical protein J437_LFUL005247 [Ladona fulva]|uniref:Peptidase M12B propeptide domain-containing protein n=1 Tax=Ladona fulva TaxID=123851 RepID=A0A8K0JXZ4_LADFU|nr:hypothetical protein J437_LFUL005247 [Ladona fulva]
MIGMSLLRHERHHHTSSHFRARNPGLWDPHPRYAFSAFGRRFRLDLNLGDSFLSPHLRVTTHQGHDNDEVIRESKPAAEEHERCFYTGTVYGDPSSSVAVNLCHGMVSNT